MLQILKLFSKILIKLKNIWFKIKIDLFRMEGPTISWNSVSVMTSLEWSTGEVVN